MLSTPGDEARFELALSTSLLNELKHGTHLSKLAESLLLSTFQEKAIEPELQSRLAAALPSVRYISLAAFLNGGVVIRSSNLAVQGEVQVRAQAMGHSAARIAAKQHSIFHGQKKAGEPIKFQELQEAWDQQECTSTVSVPIPASRHFEDAFIPYNDRNQPLPEKGTCPVLYIANGTVGVVHFGLSTEDVKLNGRQGRQFVGLAQSIGPHLGYIIAPALEALQQQIKSVAATNQQQQQLRRRSMSCSLPPAAAEPALTVHDSADSLNMPPQRPGSRLSMDSRQQPRQGHPPLPQQPAQQRPANVPTPPTQQQQSPQKQQQTPSGRMLSPFETWSAPAAPQRPGPDPPADEGAPSSPDRPGSDRLDLSPAKTALDMSMLEVARLAAGIARPGKPEDTAAPEAVLQRLSGDQGSGRKSATAAEVSAAANVVLRSSKDLDLEYQPSTEASPRGSGSQELGFGPSKTKQRRRAPVPMLRASSPLSAYGSGPLDPLLPRQLSIPGSSLSNYSQQQQQQQPQYNPVQASATPRSPFANVSGPSSLETPFAAGVPLQSHPPSSIWHLTSSLESSGSTIAIPSMLPPVPSASQQGSSSQRQHRLSPLAMASLAASLPPDMSTSAMAVLSMPMDSMPPAPAPRSMATLAMPSVLPLSGHGLPPVCSPSQQIRSMLAAPQNEPQPRHEQHQYRLPPQLPATSLLLQLLPAGSAQSLGQMMSRAASNASTEYRAEEPMHIARSCSLTNDNSTSVSVGSPKRSLMNMSRAVSEQLHLNSAGKGVQRPFLADLQQRWTTGYQGSGLLRYPEEAEDSGAAISSAQ